MIVNPLFFFLGTIFIKIFGNFGYSFHIYNGFIYGSTAFMLVLIMKQFKIEYKVIVPAITIFIIISTASLVTSYNHLAICFEIMLLLLELIKTKDDSEFIKKHPKFVNIIIGFLLICCFLIKQSMGIYIGLAYFTYLLISEKNIIFKDKISQFFYKCIGALIGLIPFILYLIINGIFNDYIDLCYGGLSDFNNNCHRIEFEGVIILFLLIHILYMFILLYKQQKKRYQILFVSFLASSLLTLYPIIDINHIMTIAPLFFIALMVLIHNNIYFSLAYTHYIIASKRIGILTSYILLGEFVLVSLSLLGLANIPNKYNIYKGYLALDDHFFEKLETMNTYIEEKEKEGYEVFFLGVDATLYRWPLGINNNKKDLFMHGNVGKNGYQETIDEILNCPKPLVIYNTHRICYQEFESLKQFFKDYFVRVDIVDDHFIYEKKL